MGLASMLLSPVPEPTPTFRQLMVLLHLLVYQDTENGTRRFGEYFPGSVSSVCPKSKTIPRIYIAV